MREPYRPTRRHHESSGPGRAHAYHTMNALTADYVNVANVAELRAGMTSSSSVRTLHVPRLDTRRFDVNSARRYSLNFSDVCAEMASHRRSDGRASSWSLSNINASSSSHPRTEVQPGIHRPYASIIKINSADNIRKLHRDWSVSSRDKFEPSNARLLEDLNEVICCQPRERKSHIVQNVESKRDNSARHSVVHWTSSVENRVCCPETVLYGAVYGLKCLK